MSIREFARPRAAFTIVLACLAAFAVPGIAGATTLPAGFQQATAISGLNDPMDVEVTPSGQVFVAEKSGIVKSFSSLSDPTPTVAADLRTQMHNFSARGLMSLAVDPYTVRALDVRQNRSDASNTVAVTVPDVVAPTAPGNLAVQAVTGARVDLAWTASTRQRGRSRLTRSSGTECCWP
jgi:hypothetical protein